jgi:hypothetical protein
MQIGPDNVPVSTQSVIIGPPLLAPAPVPVTTTITEISPLKFDPGPTLIDEPTNVRVTESYAVAVSYQGSQVTSKVTNLNFAGTGLNVVTTNSGTTITNTFTETVYNGGNATGNLTPDRNNGTIQKFTLTGNITLNPPANMTAGQSLTLILTQDSSGNHLLNANVAYLFASGFQTLSIDSDAVDMLNIFTDGSAYYTTLTVDYS